MQELRKQRNNHDQDSRDLEKAGADLKSSSTKGVHSSERLKPRVDGSGKHHIKSLKATPGQFVDGMGQVGVAAARSPFLT